MYAFVHIEKTAGSTLLSILRRSFGTRHCDIRLPLSKRRNDNLDHRVCIEAADLRRVKRIYRKLRGISGHNVKPYANLEQECPSIHYVTILRDPVARFRSHFLNRAPGHTQQDFDRWIASPWIHNWQTKMIAGEANAEKAIELIDHRFGFIGFTERFDESLTLLSQWFNEPQFVAEYKPINRLSDKRRPRDIAREKSDMSYFDSSSTLERIQDVNRADQQVCNYVSRVVYPRQVARYVGSLNSDVQQLKERNQACDNIGEPKLAAFMRNYLYKPLLHCRAL